MKPYTGSAPDRTNHTTISLILQIIKFTHHNRQKAPFSWPPLCTCPYPFSLCPPTPFSRVGLYNPPSPPFLYPPLLCPPLLCPSLLCPPLLLVLVKVRWCRSSESYEGGSEEAPFLLIGASPSRLSPPPMPKRIFSRARKGASNVRLTTRERTIDTM